jgi:CopG family transcriptional regulator/antitoxin EndoAI
LLKKIDKVAKEEMRTRSELIREASRLYIERKERWEKIFDFGKQQAERLGLKEQDVIDEIQKSLISSSKSSNLWQKSPSPKKILR